MEESNNSRLKSADAAVEQDREDISILDNLLEKLRNGDSVGRRPRRAWRTTDISVAAIPARDSFTNGPRDDAAEVARDMLARLQSDGFEAFAPLSPIDRDARLGEEKMNDVNLLELAGFATDASRDGMQTIPLQEQ